MIKKYLTLVAMLLCGLLAGCASITSGTSEKVTVTTPPVQGANCQLRNKEGAWRVDKTPGDVAVHRGHDPLMVDCKKPGYTETKKEVASYTNKASAGNILLGGVIGEGIDLASGAAYQYPKTIVVPMRKTV